MPATNIDDLNIEYEEEGQLTLKQLDKEVLSRGAWTTILFKYQEWDKNKQIYGPLKFTIRRYQKRNDMYRQMSKFNFSSVEQAQKIIEVLQRWIAEDAEKVDKA